MVARDVAHDRPHARLARGCRGLPDRRDQVVGLRLQDEDVRPSRRRDQRRGLGRVPADDDRPPPVIEPIAVGRHDRAMVHRERGDAEPVLLEDDGGARIHGDDGRLHPRGGLR